MRSLINIISGAQTELLKILATADIHSPRYLELFLKSLGEISTDPDIIVLAGDLVEKNNIYALKPIYEALLKKFGDKPIISIFGNEEYRGYEDRYISLYKQFKWINDEYLILEVKNTRIGIIGTRGALDKPTSWQAKHIPWITRYYRELPVKIARIIDEARSKGVDAVFLITHYGVTYKNLRGEPRNIWPYLASRRFEKIIVEKGIDLVIHGHAHNATIEKTMVNHTLIYNVALPGRERIVLINFEKHIKEKKGLEKWLKY